MPEHQDPGDLGLHLADIYDRIERLDSREIGMSLKSFTPRLWATGNPPRHGNNAVRVGRYCISAEGWCSGNAVMRFTASMTRGTGLYLVNLPVAGRNFDPRGYTIIGHGTIGIGAVHTTFTLHFSGAAGFRRTDMAVMAIQGGLFATHSTPSPGVDLGNIHYHFGYFVKPRVLAALSPESLGDESDDDVPPEE